MSRGLQDTITLIRIYLQNDVLREKELHLLYAGQLIVLYCTEGVHESLEVNVIYFRLEKRRRGTVQESSQCETTTIQTVF